MMAPGLDVIIVSYNTREELAACLRSLREAPPTSLDTVFVVDNASTDGSPEAARDTWPAVEVIALDRNLGFGAANNIALRKSTADLVVFLNSDTVVPPGALDTLANRLRATGAAAAGPKLVDARGRPEVSFGPMLSPLAEARQAWRVRTAARDSRRARRYVDRLVSTERTVDWVTGACLLADRRAVVAAGGFDERYFMYEEDIDLCAALRARGGRVLFTPAAEVVHLRGRSVRRSPAGTGAYDRSHLAFYAKHRPAWVPWLRAWLALRGRAIR